MLARFADREGSAYLARFHRKYKGKSAAEAEALLLRGVRPSAPRLASVLFTLEPEAGDAQLDELLAHRLGRGRRLAAQAARAARHLRRPVARRPRLRGARASARALAGRLPAAAAGRNAGARRWTRARANARRSTAGSSRRATRARRTARIRELLERDAFAQVHRSWQRLGYPFASLTPSYASAIGASGDRPAALAELMGILVNDGVRLPVQRVGALHFARDTPYETRLEQHGPAA